MTQGYVLRATDGEHMFLQLCVGGSRVLALVPPIEFFRCRASQLPGR
jgi:hypothetical protein